MVTKESKEVKPALISICDEAGKWPGEIGYYVIGICMISVIPLYIFFSPRSDKGSEFLGLREFLVEKGIYLSIKQGRNKA